MPQNQVVNVRPNLADGMYLSKPFHSHWSQEGLQLGPWRILDPLGEISSLSAVMQPIFWMKHEYFSSTYKKQRMENTQLNVSRVETSRKCLWSSHLACRLATEAMVPLRNESNWEFISLSFCGYMWGNWFVLYNFHKWQKLYFNTTVLTGFFPILCCFSHPHLPTAEDSAPSQHVHTESIPHSA